MEPNFPIPPKSKNHRDFLPIGLLKLASFHRERGDEIQLVRSNQHFSDFYPNQVKITSLFTYWSKYVWESVRFYKEAYPKAKIIVGGVYASLMPDHCAQSGCDEVFVGVDERVEKFKPAYDLVDVDYQIVHTSRGCLRKCKFCGTWKIEPKFVSKKSIKDEVCSNRVIFYDNNLLANPHIKNILEELKNAKHNDRVVYSESQCGIDGRLLTPEVAKLLKQARFLNPRIAWDHGYDQKKMIKNQIDMLVAAGYPAKEIYIFMIYNFEQDYYEMLKKLNQC
ncbi:Fe-S oxidoreductase, partial [Patescibacteria group bacterium]|nr:Fe-S oxidoreductase [Patescibacteria group bacterium]